MRKAIVTGASRGIGFAVTQALLNEGWHVTGIARTQPAVLRPNFVWLPIDLSLTEDLWVTVPPAKAGGLQLRASAPDPRDPRSHQGRDTPGDTPGEGARDEPWGGATGAGQHTPLAAGEGCPSPCCSRHDRSPTDAGGIPTRGAVAGGALSPISVPGAGGFAVPGGGADPRSAVRFPQLPKGDGPLGQFSMVEKADQPVDALIHAAGIRGPYGPMLENDPDEWIKTVQTNLLGAYHIVRAALPSLLRSEDGRVLLFSGGGAFDPSPMFSAYGATKGATVALMASLAEELRGSVSVNAIAPGFVATDIHRGTPLEGKSDGGAAMATAVACVQHMLSAHTRGLTGKTVSAQWDDFRSIDQTNVTALNDSEMGTRDRHKIACVRSLVRPPRLAAV